MIADASNYAMERVLSMRCKDKKWRPVAYISKFLSDTEKNYEIHDVGVEDKRLYMEH